MAPSKSERTNTRQRIVDASADLSGHQGYFSTGLKAILAASDAPLRSLYHFFPGGKEELGAVALRASGQTYRELVETSFPVGAHVVEATHGFFEGAAAVLEATEFADACPIATIALEVANTSDAMRQAAEDAFESWLAILERRYVEAGMAPARAREVVEAFCAIEGAFLLSGRREAPNR